MIFLILGCLVAASTAMCPFQCTCLWYHHNQYVDVNCRRRNLYEVPSGIPPQTLLLDLQSNHLTYIKSRAFEKLPKLMKLLLGNNSLTDLHADAFVGLVNLKQISFAMNRISSLKKNAFKPLKNLEFLGLPGNRISRIEPYAFRGLEKLQMLTLTKNRLFFIDIHSFHGMPVLNKLNIGENRLQNINENVFTTLSQLTVLEIPDNDITTLHSNVFSGNCHLRLLDLSGNRICEIERGAFKNLSKLVTLRLERNNLTHLRPSMFFGLRLLDILHLEGNKLKHIDDNTFFPLKILSGLFMQENNLTKINSCTLNGLLSVRVISVEMNRLRFISSDAFATNSNLERLYLQYNDLDVIEDQTFHHPLPRLRILDLSNNIISTIKPFTFRGMAQFIWDLNLYGNKLKCSCGELSYLFSLNIKTLHTTCVSTDPNQHSPFILSDTVAASLSAKWRILPAYNNEDNSSTLPCSSGTRIEARQCVPCSKVSRHPWCITRNMSTSGERCVSLHAEKVSRKDVPSCVHACHHAKSFNLTTDKLMDEKKTIKFSEKCDSNASVRYSEKGKTTINENVSRTLIVSIACGGLVILSSVFLCVLGFLRRNGEDRNGNAGTS